MIRRYCLIFPLSVLLVIPLLSQQRDPPDDGYAHGDPPFLIEDGWAPLLTGKDLSGWRTHDNEPNGWYTTRGVRWEPYLGPTLLQGVAEPGGRIVNGKNGRTANLVSDQKFGDVELYVEFLLAKASNSGVYLHGLYEIQVFDSFGTPYPVTSSDCGGVYHRWIDNQGVGGSAPKLNASRRAGEWQSFHIWFRAPRFDANGKKTENARFIRVLHNGLLIQEEYEVDGPTRAHLEIAEAPENPIMLQGDHGPVAYRNIHVRPLRPLRHR